MRELQSLGSMQGHEIDHVGVAVVVVLVQHIKQSNP